MAQTVEQALREARLYTDGQDYLMLRLPTAAVTAAAGVLAEIGEPFGALIVDKDEVTLVIPADALEAFARRLPGHELGATQYRLITFDVELEPTLIGFMAQVSRALADAGVTILPFAAFSRDHLLVPSAQLDIAMQALEMLRSK